MNFRVLFIIFLFSITYSIRKVHSSEHNIEVENKININQIENSGEIRSVVTNGFGLSINEATRDAATNALKQVVGSFIDANTILQEETKINNGIMQESSTIKENIREYSQGSIKYFEILSKNKNGSLYQVRARVEVRIKEFNTYIQKFAYSKSDFPGANIAAVINANKNNAEQSTLFFADKVIKPLIERSVYEIAVGEPELLRDNSIRVPISIYLNEQFIKNIERTLDNITTASYINYQKKEVPYTIRALIEKKKGFKKKEYFIKTTNKYIDELTYDSCFNENFEKKLDREQLRSKRNKDLHLGYNSMCGYNQYIVLKKGLSGFSDVQALLNSQLTLPLQINLISDKKEVISSLVCGLRDCYSGKKIKHLVKWRLPVYLPSTMMSQEYDESFKAKKMYLSKIKNEECREYISCQRNRYENNLSLIDYFVGNIDIYTGDRIQGYVISSKKDFMLQLDFAPDQVSKIKDIEVKFEKLN